MKLINPEFKEEISLRIKKIRYQMNSFNTQAVLIGYNSNIYYSTGRFFRGFVYIAQDQKPLWFVIKPQIFDLDKDNDLFYIRKPEQIPDILKELDYKNPNTIGLEEDDLSYSEIIRLQKLFPFSKISNGSIILKRARMTKTEWEINEIKEDGIHQSKVYGEIKDCYRPGMSDVELQIEIEKKLRLEGALGVSRVSGNLMEINLGSVIAGDNADNPGPYDFTMAGAGMNDSLPVGANGSVILEGQTVMIDMTGAFNGYQSDMTRVWSKGKIPTLAIKAHECSRKILRKLEQITLPGSPVSHLYDEALKIVEEDGLKEFFMGHKSQVSFIGHGVGIELNELPVINSKSKDIIEENMTLAIEPKFVLPGIGAVGIENTYVVKATGLQNLTFYPENIEIFR